MHKFARPKVIVSLYTKIIFQKINFTLKLYLVLSNKVTRFPITSLPLQTSVNSNIFLSVNWTKVNRESLGLIREKSRRVAFIRLKIQIGRRRYFPARSDVRIVYPAIIIRAWRTRRKGRNEARWDPDRFVPRSRESWHNGRFDELYAPSTRSNMLRMSAERSRATLLQSYRQLRYRLLPLVDVYCFQGRFCPGRKVGGKTYGNRAINGANCSFHIRRAKKGRANGMTEAMNSRRKAVRNKDPSRRVQELRPEPSSQGRWMGKLVVLRSLTIRFTFYCDVTLSNWNCFVWWDIWNLIMGFLEF